MEGTCFLAPSGEASIYDTVQSKNAKGSLANVEIGNRKAKTKKKEGIGSDSPFLLTSLPSRDLRFLQDSSFLGLCVLHGEI